jgi:hypothetical protein
MGGGSKKQSSTTTQELSPTQEAFYKDLFGRAGGKMDSGGFFDDQYAGGAQTFAEQTPEQRAMYERLTGAGGTLEQGLGTLEQRLGPYDPNNAALTGVIDMAAGDVNRNLQENLLPAIGDGATGAGQFGSTRQGVAEGIALRGASEQVGDIATQLRYQDMQDFQDRQTGAIEGIGTMANQFQSITDQGQMQEQSKLDDLFSRWEYESQTDLKNLQAYAGLGSGQDMGGTSNTVSKGGGK